MADYDLRATRDYAFGQLSAGVGTSDTTLASAAFANLPSDLSTTKYLPITLTDAAAGLYEIVWITAHTAAATSVTAVRAREGSTAQVWAASTPWACAPTVRDGLPVTTRAGLPTDAYIGQRVLLSDESQVVERVSGAWTNGPLIGAYARYYQTSNQSLPNTTNTPLAMDGAANTTPLVTRETSGAGHKLTLGRAGLWLAVASMRYAASAATRELFMSIEWAGVGPITATSVVTNINNAVTLSTSGVHPFAVGNSVQINSWHSNGSALLTEAGFTHLTLMWLRDYS